MAELTKAEKAARTRRENKEHEGEENRRRQEETKGTYICTLTSFGYS
jgi:hypothetical protein